ncbi:MAG: hypothetical protein RL514_320 [Verrucomicrobiota bacterium]
MVGIIGMICALALPNLFKSRNTAQRNTCIGNLKQIDSAMQQWAVTSSKSATDTYSLLDGSLDGYIKTSRLPECPGGGFYTAGSNVSVSPSCSLASIGHTL